MGEFAVYEGKPWYWCRPCQRAKSREYGKKFPEKVKDQSRRYREQHPDYAAANSRAWRAKNKEAYKQKLREYRLVRVAKDPLWDRRRNIHKLYKITLEQYEAMYRDQSGVCKICGALNIAGRRLAVDHDHKTGRIRGLLCSRCNMAIGLFKDDLDLLRRAFEYVEGVVKL